MAPGATAGLFASPKKRTVVLCLALAAFTLLLYNPVAHHEFVNYDDDRYIANNPHLVGGLTWQNFSWAFRTTYESNWHPITWLSHQLDYQLFRLDPTGHHYVNLLLHVLNAVLLFLLLDRATRLPWRSLMVAALFAVHPINVESVAWAAERKNLLCTLFFLLALAAYGWYVKQPGVRRYLLVALAFALGLTSKPMVITLPFVLLLMDYWPLGRMQISPQADGAERVGAPRLARFAREPGAPFWYLLIEKAPLLVLSAASAVMTIIAQRAGLALRSLTEYSLHVRLENAVVSYVVYLRQAIWPSGLAVLYPHPKALPIWEVASSVIVLGGITAGVCKLRDRRYLAAGWLWFVGTLVPVIGLLQVGKQAMADRYAYIPFIGPFVMIVWGVSDLAGNSAGSDVPSHSARRCKFMAAGGVVWLGTLAIATHIQLGYWQDGVALWSRALAVTHDNFIAHDGLGTALVMRGKPEEAILQFRAAEKLFPNDWISQLNIAAYEQQHGHLQEAMEHYKIGVLLTPDAAMKISGLANLGTAYRIFGDYTHASESYEAALRLDPDNAQSLIGLGLLAQKRGEFGQAAEYYSRAVRVQPADIGFLLLAQALEQQGRRDEASMATEQARQLSHDLARARERAIQLLQ